MSAYQVLGRDASGYWQQCALVDASSAEQAVRHAVERIKGNPEYDRFVAIPNRSWRPMAVERVEVVHTKVNPAKAESAA